MSPELVPGTCGWDLLALFWDELTEAEKTAIDDGYEEEYPDYYEHFDPFDLGSGDTSEEPCCAGIANGTVMSAKVAVKVWYWDEEEIDANSLTIDNGTSTQGISAQDWLDVWGLDGDDKDWYDERGGSVTDVNGVFYSMTETGQYFFLKMTVAADGVLDNLDNLFDADPSTQDRESTVRDKLKIDGSGNLSILETTYE